MPEKRLRVVLVTTFPPSLGPLNEYGYHLARGFCQREEVAQLIVLADKTVGGEVFTHPRLRTVRCWAKNHWLNPLFILKAVVKARPDVVLFNLHTGFYFGTNRLAHAIGMLSPIFAKVSGSKVAVILHNFTELVDLSQTIYKNRQLDRFFGHWVIRLMVAAVDKVVLLSETHQRIFNKAYGTRRTVVIPHGVLFTASSPSEASETGNGAKKVLCFGRFMRTRDYQLLAEAFQDLRTTLPGTELILAGAPYPPEPEFMEQVRQQYGTLPGVTFLGFIPEEKIPWLFTGVDLVVLPYKTNSGVSGPVHIACAYGKPIVAPDLPEVRELRDLGAGILLYQPGDRDALLKSMRGVLCDSELQLRLRALSMAYSGEYSFGKTLDGYLNLFAGHPQQM